jgi:hypothetical protein
MLKKSFIKCLRRCLLQLTLLLATSSLPLAQIPPSATCSGFTGCDNPAPCGFGRCADQDHDGLCDSWEVAGGIDLNGDGEIDDEDDLPLPGADPSRPDIYLQYDYMVLPGHNGHSHRPHPQAIRAVVDAFARQGIALHAFRGHRLPHYSVVTFDSVDHVCSGDDAINFYDLKALSFDPRRALAYHYVVFAHYNTCGSPGGCSSCNETIAFGGGGRAENPGNDLIVSLGPFMDAGLTPGFEQEAAVFMHELGHNFRLQHPFPKYKPNWLSVVNETFVYTGIPVGAGPGSTTPISCHVTADCPAEAICASFSHTCTRIDYSRQALADLNEASLDESVGIGAGTNDLTGYQCPDFTGVYSSATGPIDWNCNGDASETNVMADINADGCVGLIGCFGTRGGPLTGHRDWGTLDFHFQCSRGGDPLVTPPPRHEQREPTIPDAMRKHILFARRAVEVMMVGAEPGALSVAILGADDLDTEDIDGSSLKLAGARPARTRFAGPRLLAGAGPHRLSGWLKNSQAFVARVRP